MSVESDTETAQATLLLNPRWMFEKFARAGACSSALFQEGHDFLQKDLSRNRIAAALLHYLWT